MRKSLIFKAAFLLMFYAFLLNIGVLMAQVVKAGPKSVCYVEVNSNNFINTGCYLLKNGNQQLFDIAVIFAANINYDVVNKKAVLFNNGNVHTLLANKNILIKPLQDKGIKVTLSLLGNHQGAGICNFTSRAAAKAFAKIISDTVAFYGLDGVDFDDEYADYGVNGTGQPNDSSFVLLLSELRSVMPGKLISFYFFGPATSRLSYKNQKAGDFVNYSWNAIYGTYSAPVVPGLNKSQLSAAAVKINNTSAATALQLAQRTKTDGYGIFLYYDLHGNDESGYLSPISTALYGDGAKLTAGCLQPWPPVINNCTTAFEPNETQAAAKIITAGAANSAAITTATDVDYFKIVTTGISNNTFNLTGPAGLDYDLFIYNSAGTQIGSGESAANIETVALANQTAGTYYIKVIGYGGALSTNCYTIKATVSSSGGAITGSDKKIINRASGKALDDLGYNTADAAAIGQWTYAANVNQLWQFTDIGGGYYKIQNKYSGKVLDNLGFSTADGTGIVQYGYVGGANQQWQAVNLGTGYYKIINKHSGKLLDNPGSGTADGTQVIQYADNGGGFNQQWQISDATAGVSGIPSQPLSSQLTADASTAVKIVPNPVTNSTTIIVNAKRTIMAIMQVVDAGGAVVLFSNQQLTSGINRIELNTTELAAGTYYVMVKMNESVITKQMAVAK
jgi:hypothetical protein